MGSIQPEAIRRNLVCSPIAAYGEPIDDGLAKNGEEWFIVFR
jgi:hypothetical protein